MNKRYLILFGAVLVVLLLGVSLTRCSKTSNTSMEALEEGKIALASLEYEKARNLFELAYTEDKDNTEAVDLYNITRDILKLSDAIKEKDLVAAKEYLDKLNSSKNIEYIKESLLPLQEKVALLEDKIKSDMEKKEKELINAQVKDEEEKNISTVEKKEENSETTELDKIIAIAKAEILKYLNHEEELIYLGMMTFDNSSGVFATVEQLYGKTMLHFCEKSDVCPAEFVYDNNTGDVYLLTQGQVFWMNNGNIHLNGEDVAEIPKSSANITLEVNITSEQSREIARNYYLSTHRDIEADMIFVTINTEVNENNEYPRLIAFYDETKTTASKPVAEYYVNAATGEVRVAWE